MKAVVQVVAVAKRVVVEEVEAVTPVVVIVAETVLVVEGWRRRWKRRKYK